jgi:hypothetical protein
MEEVRHTSLLVEGGERKGPIILEISQASSAHPSDKGIMKVKMLGCLEIVACDRGRRILIF